MDKNWVLGLVKKAERDPMSEGQIAILEESLGDTILDRVDHYWTESGEANPHTALPPEVAAKLKELAEIINDKMLG